MRNKIGLIMIILVSMMLVMNIETKVFAARLPYLEEDVDNVISGYIFGNENIVQRREDIARILVEDGSEEQLEGDGFYIGEYNDGYVYFTMNEDDNEKYDLHIYTFGSRIEGNFLFANYENCTEIIISSSDFNFCNMTNEISCANMFDGCSSLINLDLGDNFDTSYVTNMSAMFAGCSSLVNLDLGDNFDTSYVTSMSAMFAECSSLTSIPEGLNMSFYDNGMFYNCTALTSVVIDCFFIYDKAFYGCNNLTNITFTSNFYGAISMDGNTELTEGCFTYTGEGKLKTNLINNSEAFANYDWSADNRVLVVPDTIAPTGTISLGSTYYEANGYKYVKSNEITINLTASDNVSEQSNIKVALINEKDYSRTNSNSSINWLNFSPSIQWTASSGAGLKRVYVIFKDEAGNQSLYLAM